MRSSLSGSGAVRPCVGKWASHMARLEMPCGGMWLVGPRAGREVVRSLPCQGGRCLVWSSDEHVSGTGGSSRWSLERVTCWGGPVGLAWRRGSHGDGVLLGAMTDGNTDTNLRMEYRGVHCRVPLPSFLWGNRVALSGWGCAGVNPAIEDFS